MRLRGLLLALVAVIPGNIQSQSTASTLRRVEGGELRGSAEHGILRFLGIPYAAPPVGQLRWRDPVPVQSWVGVRDATRPAPTCPHREPYPEDAPAAPMAEDCLYLNVWAPASPGRRKLPVMVWLHGGSFRNGSGSAPHYDGSRLAANGTVVVTLNYRLGVLGFLAHPDISRESTRASSGNQGLYDQVAALRWIQRNISAFGGDSTRVTVFGQSAGATAISIHVTSPLTCGLLHGAIAQSGGLFEPLALAPNYQMRIAEAEGEAYAARLGASGLDALRAVPVDRLLAEPFATHPVVDGTLLVGAPFDRYVQGNAHAVPLIIGLNAQEGRSFVGHRPATMMDVRSALAASFGAQLATLLLPDAITTTRAPIDVLSDIEGAVRFGWNVETWARLHAKHAKAPVYRYQFNGAAVGKASHGAELRYVFGTLPQMQGERAREQRTLAMQLLKAWATFATVGVPQVDFGRWPSYSPASPAIRQWGAPLAPASPFIDSVTTRLNAMYDPMRGNAHREEPAEASCRR